METQIVNIDSQNIDSEKIKSVAKILKDGGLVVFPTETVYGLGANALNSESIKAIYKAKGRPSDNPLILHIAEVSQLEDIVEEISQVAYKLIEKFWPGPLTLVMKKSDKVSKDITAGLDTVAVRMPMHPVALSLIYEAGVPVAAPSANSSGKPSPTIAKHVMDDLCGKVDIIVDSGRASVGLESTVLDISTQEPVILRPGGVTKEEIERVIKNIKLDSGLLSNEKISKPKAPGMKYTHYSPKAKVVVVNGKVENIITKIIELVRISNKEGKKTGIFVTDETIGKYKEELSNISENVSIISAGNRKNKSSIASNLFQVLRAFDDENCDIIYAEAVDENDIGLAIMNRMNKASGYNCINV